MKGISLMSIEANKYSTGSFQNIIITLICFLVGQNILNDIVKIVPTLEERKLLRGLDGEYMKQAAAVLIEKCSLASLPLQDHKILGKGLTPSEEFIFV